MKYIKKDIKNEPQDLKKYRETTPNASYSGFPSKENLRLTLLKEQGYLCAYCMKQISAEINNYYKPKIEIEHYKSQENFPKEDLNYKNMLGVCNGVSNTIEHCDKSRKYIKNHKTHSLELKRLNPTIKRSSEELITYDLNGKVLSKSNNADVENDINDVLNLNNKYLIDSRNDALDKAKEDFRKENPKKRNKPWTVKMFDDEIEKYKLKDKAGKYKSYCQFIIWHFTLQKNRSKYN
ncbi:MAG: TIGR02646 family protein [Bacteroidales bacterium]|nr:TIGR02646 family protein [Bacteroidales bacterium]